LEDAFEKGDISTSDNEEPMVCPYCGQEISLEVKVCPHCNRTLRGD